MLGSDRNFDTNNNDRPEGVGRNTEKGFDFASFDLRLSRRFRLTDRVGLDALAEGFNLFNRANLAVPNSTLGTGITRWLRLVNRRPLSIRANFSLD